MTASDFSLVRYVPSLKGLWNRMVTDSKNGTFLFLRDYMDYHAEKYADFSFLFFYKNNPYCIVPGCVTHKEYSSHAGLTYGGLVMTNQCRAEGVLHVFDLFLDRLYRDGFEILYYKPVPHIYHRIPSEEDLYALFRHNAILSVRNISTTILLKSPLPFKKDRTAALKRARKHHVEVYESSDYAAFWKILEENLNFKYAAKPTHSLEQIEYLRKKFPNNIRLFSALEGDEMIGGVVCYVTNEVVHTQYISATERGKIAGAIDLIIEHLIEEFKTKRFFDFGTSCENGGYYLNESLIYQKEGFGGRGICYDTYTLKI